MRVTWRRKRFCGFTAVCDRAAGLISAGLYFITPSFTFKEHFYGGAKIFLQHFLGSYQDLFNFRKQENVCFTVLEITEADLELISIFIFKHVDFAAKSKDCPGH